MSASVRPSSRTSFCQFEPNDLDCFASVWVMSDRSSPGIASQNRKSLSKVRIRVG